jgi:Holliday junction resolvase RusA-like endonuclease
MAGIEPNRHRPTRITPADLKALTGRTAPRKPRMNHRRWTSKVATRPEPFKLTLPFLPPSVNKLFTTVRDPESGVIKRVLTQKARRIRRLITAMISTELNPNCLYELQVDVHMPCFTKKGDVRKADLTNRVKFLEDCVCTALGIDDSRVFRVVLTKHDSETEMTVVRIDEYLDQAGREAA